MKLEQIKRQMIMQQQMLEEQEMKLYDIIEMAINTIPDLKNISTEKDWSIIENHPATSFYAHQIDELSKQRAVIRDVRKVFRKHNI